MCDIAVVTGIDGGFGKKRSFSKMCHVSLFNENILRYFSELFAGINLMKVLFALQVNKRKCTQMGVRSRLAPPAAMLPLTDT